MDAPTPARAYYMINLLDTLRAFRGEAHRYHVFGWMIEHGVARPEDLAMIQTDGGTRFRKHVDFSRKELFDAGMIADGGPGIWVLTPSGWETHLNHKSANEVVRLNQKLRALREKVPKRLSGGEASRESAKMGPTKGPKPTSWSGIVTRDVLGPAYTYIMRFGDSAVWKIGHAKSVEARLREVNKHVPSELLYAEWRVISRERWENSVLAHAMEQRIFKLLKRSRTRGERIRCPKETLLKAWNDAAVEVRDLAFKSAHKKTAGSEPGVRFASGEPLSSL